MGWRDHLPSLARAITRHLGEDITVEPNYGGGLGTLPLRLGGSSRPATVVVRGVLTRPEEAVRLGMADVTVGDGMLSIQSSEAPPGFRKGAHVQTPQGERFGVVRIDDDGEGMLEAMLCRS